MNDYEKRKKVYIVMEIKRDKDRNVAGVVYSEVFTKKVDAENELIKHNPFDTSVIESTLR